MGLSQLPLIALEWGQGQLPSLGLHLMPIVRRLFEQILPALETSPSQDRLIDTYFDKQVVIVLGPPGIGKTTVFENAALEEANAIFCTVSEFLLDPIEIYRGKTLYLDALDEHRAEIHQGETIINSIRGRLLELGCPKVRIASRGEEWRQGSDVSSLQACANGEPIHVLALRPLQEDDVAEIASEATDNAEQFIEGARDNGLLETLSNPETLKLYLEVFKVNGGWPETRAALMQQSTKLLLHESNETHERARGDGISDERLICAAEDLSAILLFSSDSGISLNRISSSNHYTPLQELNGIDIEASKVVSRRRLFSSSTPERIQPQHKTTGDYLAARAIVRRIRNDELPLSRALTLLTGRDAAPLSHTRDVYAWLIALMPDRADRLIKSDPFGALIFGDVSQWPISVRRNALAHLSEYAKNNDPWFRANSWYSPLLGALPCDALIDDFRQIIRNELCPHVTSVVLSALEHSTPIQELNVDLLSFIYKPGRPNHDWLRPDALRVLSRTASQKAPDLKVLLADIQSGLVPDEDRMLLACLLSELYPTAIPPEEIVHYFAQSDISGPGTIGWFIRYDLVAQTPIADIPRLADAIIAHPDCARKLDEFDRASLSAQIVGVLLEQHVESAAPQDILHWLGLLLDELSFVQLDRDDLRKLSQTLAGIPNLYHKLFRHWLSQATPDKHHGFRFLYQDFTARLLHIPPPADFPRTLLEEATRVDDGQKAAFMVALAFDHVIQDSSRHFDIDFEVVSTYADDHAEFWEIWDQKRVSEISDWRWKQAEHSKNRRAAESFEINKSIRILAPRLELLRNGTDTANLHFGALNWFGITRHSNQETSPFDRIKQKTNQEIAEAITEGFQNLLRLEDQPTPSQIAALQCQGRQYHITFPTLAGADIVFARSPDEFLSLPERSLRTALAFHIVMPIEAEKRMWHRAIEETFPDLAKSVIGEIWRTEVSCGKKENLSGSHVNRTEEVHTAIVLTEITQIMREALKLPPSILANFVKTVLVHGDPHSLKEACELALNDSSVHGTARSVWMALAALFWPEKFDQKLRKRTRENLKDAHEILEILTSGSRSLMNGSNTVPQLRMSISLLGSLFNNVYASPGFRAHTRMSLEDAARSVRALIDTLSGISSEEARDALDHLISDPSLHEWRDYLRHSRANQTRGIRENQFRRPSAQEVCSLLNNDQPISPEDLMALALSVLDDLSIEVRGDNSNLWKQFWTLAAKGKLNKPKIENDSRDSLLPWLRTMLTSKDIIVEPEGAAADQKRVDIRLSHPLAGTLPIEVKRDDNKDLWSALRGQLLEKYAIDPRSRGYGIYLVLWYGPEGSGCKTPPEELGIPLPTSASELQRMLESIRPSQKFEIRVLDVTKPHDA